MFEIPYKYLMKQQNAPSLNFSRSELSSSKTTLFSQKRFSQNNQILTTGDNLENQKECRICLQVSDSEEDPLVSPCHCAGTLKYVHEECFKSWILKILQKKSQPERDALIHQGFECQLCKYFLNIAISFKSRCSEGSQVVQNIRNQKSKVFCFLFFFIANAVCICLLAHSIASSKIDYKENPAPLIVLLLCMIFVTIVEIAVIVKFIKNFCLGTEMVINGFALKPGKQEKKPQIISICTRRRRPRQQIQ